MAQPIPDHKRQAIVEAIRAGGKRNQIAREHGVAASTVTKIARDAGLTDAFDRSQTENATRASVADFAALRTQVTRDLLEAAISLRGRESEPHEVVAGGPDGPTIIKLSKPPPREVQALQTARAIAIDKSIAVERHERGEDDPSALGAFLAAMMGPGNAAATDGQGEP